MVTYVVNYTDANAEPISIAEKVEYDENLPITLFGRRKLEYGEKMNENILHLLENFACPELLINGVGQGTPDLTVALDNTLANAIDGQLWYNSTQKVLYQRTGGVWIPLGHLGEVASNFGTMLGDGTAPDSQLPLPVSDTGYVFTYDECSWLVSPRTYDGVTQGMVCTTDANAVVTHTYEIGGSTVVGTVNYMIIGIRDAATQAPNVPVSPAPLPPTPTIDPTVTVTPTVTTTPTPLPDPEIIWAGNTIDNSLSSDGYIGNLLLFRSDAGIGPAGQANMEYWNGVPLYEGWLDTPPVSDGEYWIKIELLTEVNIEHSGLVIMDNVGSTYLFDQPNDYTLPFDANQAQIMIDNSVLVIGQSASLSMMIYICADDGLGAPDESWVGRLVNISVAKV